jgi:hypothetical protein
MESKVAGLPTPRPGRFSSLGGGWGSLLAGGGNVAAWVKHLVISVATP